VSLLSLPSSTKNPHKNKTVQSKFSSIKNLRKNRSVVICCAHTHPPLIQYKSIAMGCTTSAMTRTGRNNHRRSKSNNNGSGNDAIFIEDSLLAMMKRDAKQAQAQGRVVPGYRHREPHPLLLAMQVANRDAGDGGDANTGAGSVGADAITAAMSAAATTPDHRGSIRVVGAAQKHRSASALDEDTASDDSGGSSRHSAQHPILIASTV
jgi:hypothetical protein